MGKKKKYIFHSLLRANAGFLTFALIGGVLGGSVARMSIWSIAQVPGVQQYPVDQSAATSSQQSDYYYPSSSFDAGTMQMYQDWSSVQQQSYETPQADPSSPPLQRPECENGVDDDGDLMVDDDDSECKSSMEGEHANSCSDSRDNNYDGLVDGADQRCQSAMQAMQQLQSASSSVSGQVTQSDVQDATVMERYTDPAIQYDSYTAPQFGYPYSY